MSFSISDSFLAEYQSLTTGCGSVWLDDWSTVSISGEDRTAFLHNMCTNDIRQLARGEGCEVFFTDVKGKIVTHSFVLALENELNLLAVPEQAPTIIEHLDRYIIREDVQLRDESDKYGWLLVSGAKSSQELESLAGSAGAQLEAPWQNAQCLINEAEVLIVRFRTIWPESFLLRYPKNKNVCLQTLLDIACGTSAWTAVRVESGFPLFGVDFDHSNLPQEVSRNDQAINFNKGCYLGQETIARIDALGHVNQQIVSLRFAEDAIPQKGAELVFEGKNVGEVTTASWSPRQQAPVAMAMVRRGANNPGSVLQSENGQATVIQLSQS